MCGFKSSGPQRIRKNTQKGQRLGGNCGAFLLPRLEKNVLNCQKGRELKRKQSIAVGGGAATSSEGTLA